MKQSLPIDQIRVPLIDALQHCPRAIVTADPGSGKSTLLPLFFIGDHRRILVAQPRRIAARSLAEYVAGLRHERVGESVGYRVRYDTRTSAKTRLEYVTDGILIRLLQGDPELDGIDMVILDEFHERSLNLDLALAMLMELQAVLRPDLKLVLMSATLDTAILSKWLDAPHFHAPGLIFPNEIHRSAQPIPFNQIVNHTAAKVLEILADVETKNCLVFLPSSRLIHAVQDALIQRTKVKISLLYGQQGLSQQTQVMNTKEQHVILATNIAETSLTIPNVNRVVDTGWRREARYVRPWAAHALFDSRISHFSARQRAGRANRNGAGKVYQLWTDFEDQGMNAQDLPQICTSNLEQLYLECLHWGTVPNSLTWLTPPPKVTLDDAKLLLDKLEVLDGNTLNPSMGTGLKSQFSPRGQVVMSSAAHLSPEDKLRVAYLLPLLDGERMPSKGSGSLESRLSTIPEHHVYAKTVKRVAHDLGLTRTRLSCPATLMSGSVLGVLLQGFPERLAQRRDTHSRFYLMASGCGGKVHPKASPSPPEYAFALSVGGVKSTELTLFEIIDVEANWIPCQQEDVLYFSQPESRVICRRRLVFEQIILEETPSRLPDDAQAVTVCLVDAVLATSLPVFTRTPAFESLCTRIRLVLSASTNIVLPTPLKGDATPADRDILMTLCAHKRSFAELSKIDLHAQYVGQLTYHQNATLNRIAPTSIKLSNGQTVRVHYDPTQGATISTRFEWLFGVIETPLIGGSPALLELLAPNMRPIQMTRDLKSFWMNGYPEVRKSLRGRYPKHPWPEDPTTAKPGVGRRRSLKAK